MVLKVTWGKDDYFQWLGSGALAREVPFSAQVSPRALLPGQSMPPLLASQAPLPAAPPPPPALSLGPRDRGCWRHRLQLLTCVPGLAPAGKEEEEKKVLEMVTKV